MLFPLPFSLLSLGSRLLMLSASQQIPDTQDPDEAKAHLYFSFLYLSGLHICISLTEYLMDNQFSHYYKLHKGRDELDFSCTASPPSSTVLPSERVWTLHPDCLGSNLTSATCGLEILSRLLDFFEPLNASNENRNTCTTFLKGLF